MSEINVLEIVQALDGKSTDSLDTWLCHCPAHDDKEPSLSLSKENGRILFHCHAGCTQEAVLEALKSRGLWPEPEKRTKNLIVATYDYQDEAGKLLFQVCRFEPKDFRQRRPDCKGGWLWNLKETRRVLYRLPELLKADQVFIPEGEKDVVRLVSEGLRATTCPGGAGKWRSEYSDSLRGKDCIILPDNDAPGHQHAQQVAKSLQGQAKSCKILELPGLPEKGDVSNWLEAGHTGIELLTLAMQAEPVKNDKPSYSVISISDFLAEKLPPRENILKPWLPKQGLAMIHSKRGIGKTFVSLNIAFAVVCGGSFLRWKAKPAGVLFLDGEMPANVIQERLSQMVLKTELEPQKPLLFMSPDMQDRAMPDLSTNEGQKAVEKYLSHDIELIIIDNISTLSRSGKENEASSWLPLQEWALKLRAQGKAVLFIHHSGKGGLQRGTSKREDILDTVISLRHTVDYEPSQGACFEVHFEKSRGIYGADVEPFEARLVDGLWTVKSLKHSTYEKVIRLTKEGYSQKELADEIGKNKGYISRLVKQAKEKGDLP